MKEKRIIVTGGGGSIGSEIVRQLAPDNKIFILDNNETATFDLSEELSQKGYWIKPRIGDIRNPDTIKDLFSDFKPQYIFHTAAYKHVSPMEMYSKEAIDTNVLGTYYLIQEAKQWKCLEKFVFISTDKAVQSTSIMGATKRLGEIMVRNQGKGFMVVRFGNVLGSRGSVIPIWQKQINDGKPLTVTHPEMTRYFMTIEEAVGLTIQAVEEGKGGEIYVLDMGKSVSILQLAKDIIQGARYEGGIKEIGVRPGELMHEKLMSEEEEKVAIKKDNFYIIK